MKTLIKFVLATAITITSFVAQAGGISGHFRSNGTYVAPHYRSDLGSLGRASSYNYTPGYTSGYVYRNPNAAYPSVTVRGYYRSNIGVKSRGHSDRVGAGAEGRQTPCRASQFLGSSDGSQ
ncbi:MAG: hypothetical protein ACYDH9_24500 [Limisphaerales bacterium]